MPKKESTSKTPTPTNNLNLNSLTDLSFGPSWAEQKNSNKIDKKDYAKNNKQKNIQRSGNPNKDRRNQIKFRNKRLGSSISKRKQHFENRKPKFVPKFDVKIYPQDETFERLIKKLKGNFKTYQLFEITRLILEKSDRFICLINRVEKKMDGSEEPIYFTPEDNLPFDSEEDAINHFCEHYIGIFFDIETIEAEPPKGNFSVVYRCPFTKVLIGPPNYHRCPVLLKAHYNAKIKNLSFEDYQKKLESLSEENFINDWIEITKQQKHYTLKKEKNHDDAPIKFLDIEEARRFLISNYKEKIVKTSSNFRFDGNKLENLPDSNLKQSITNSIETQRRFPLETANNIRGRLRRHKFTIYKKGSKGISYVCCVKRKFRTSATVFTDSINSLISFIERNQQINISALPYKFLSIDIPLKNKDSKIEDLDTSSENEKLAENKYDSENFENSQKEDSSKITEVIRNIRWLISEGYVTEYSDGKLWIHPITETNITSPASSKNKKTREPNVVEEAEIIPTSKDEHNELGKNDASIIESCGIPYNVEEQNET